MNAYPPAILRRLLMCALPPGPVRDGLLGDLDEMYSERVRNGRATTNLWYTRQLLSAAGHYLLRRVWARGTAGEGATMTKLAKDLRQDPMISLGEE